MLPVQNLWAIIGGFRQWWSASFLPSFLSVIVHPSWVSQAPPASTLGECVRDVFAIYDNNISPGLLVIIIKIIILYFIQIRHTDDLKVKRALTCKVKFDQNSVQSQPEPGLTWDVRTHIGEPVFKSFWVNPQTQYGWETRHISRSVTKETEGGHVSPGSGWDWTEFWSNFTLQVSARLILKFYSVSYRKQGSHEISKLWVYSKQVCVTWYKWNIIEINMFR